jgi:hypothetical protein
MPFVMRRFSMNRQGGMLFAEWFILTVTTSIRGLLLDKPLHHRR